MSKQYESAYETICAQKYMKQCVVALNNNLQQAKKIFVRESFDNVRSLYSSLFAFGLITQLIVFWKFFAFLFVSWSLRFRWYSSDCLSRISWRGLLYFSAPVERWTYKLGTHKKHAGTGHILGVTKDKQKRGRTCAPLLYFKSLVVGLFFVSFESDVCLCLFPCATTRLIVFFLSVWQDISLSPR